MIDQRPHVGWEVRCDAYGCTATTAAQVPASSWLRSSDLALHAARTLGWLSLTIRTYVYWVCPLHQTWDPRLNRWVAQPGSIHVTRRRTA